MKTCVFAGTFDPLSKGHEFVINKCLELFDKVVIAIGKNVDKTPMFSLEDRKKIIESAFDNEKIEVVSFDGMLTDFMIKRGIKYNVRGVRSLDDYKYESNMAHYNEDMFKDIVNIFIPTPINLSYVSSTAIRNIIELGSDYSKYLPDRAVKIVDEIITKNGKK